MDGTKKPPLCFVRKIDLRIGPQLFGIVQRLGIGRFGGHKGVLFRPRMGRIRVLELNSLATMKKDNSYE